MGCWEECRGYAAADFATIGLAEPKLGLQTATVRGYIASPQPAASDCVAFRSADLTNRIQRAQQSEMLKSTRRSIASLESSRPVPISTSLEPTPVAFNLSASPGELPCSRSLMY